LKEMRGKTSPRICRRDKARFARPFPCKRAEFAWVDPAHGCGFPTLLPTRTFLSNAKFLGNRLKFFMKKRVCSNLSENSRLRFDVPFHRRIHVGKEPPAAEGVLNLHRAELYGILRVIDQILTITESGISSGSIAALSFAQAI